MLLCFSARICMSWEIGCTLCLSHPVPSINGEHGIAYQYKRFVFLLRFDRSRSYPVTEKATFRSLLDNQNTFIFEKENMMLFLFLSCIPTHPHKYTHTHTHTHWNTWLIRDCCSASNIITLLPTLVSMETSFQSWLVPDRCESAQTKKGRGGRGLFVFKHDRKKRCELCVILVPALRWSESPAIHAYRCEKESVIFW